MVTVKVASGELTEELVGVHSVVVMCGRPGEEVYRWNAFCHERVGYRNKYFCLAVPCSRGFLLEYMAVSNGVKMVIIIDVLSIGVVDIWVFDDME